MYASHVVFIDIFFHRLMCLNKKKSPILMYACCVLCVCVCVCVCVSIICAFVTVGLSVSVYVPVSECVSEQKDVGGGRYAW